MINSVTHPPTHEGPARSEWMKMQGGEGGRREGREGKEGGRKGREDHADDLGKRMVSNLSVSLSTISTVSG
jgi:hypothetical protein